VALYVVVSISFVKKNLWKKLRVGRHRPRRATLHGIMTNGHDKNWIRLCGAIDGFRVRYGRWPQRVRLFPVAIRDLREHIFSPEDFAKITTRIELVPDEDAPLIAEDDTGASYNYGKEGFPKENPTPRAAEWLNVTPRW